MQKIKQQLRNIIVTSVMVPLLLSSSALALSPADNFATGGVNPVTGCTGGVSLLTLPCWYRGLKLDAQGKPLISGLGDIWIVVLNGVDALIQIAGYTAMGYIIWGGFKYMKSRGDPAKINEARGAILDASIGLVIAIGSVAIVQLVATNIAQKP